MPTDNLIGDALSQMGVRDAQGAGPSIAATTQALFAFSWTALLDGRRLS
jgi:hypothetical protein